MSEEIRTKRLRLIAATPLHIRAELQAPDRLSVLIEADVSSSWPPGEYDRDAMEFFIGRLESGGEAAAGWYNWYAVRRGIDLAQLVGSGGYMGPPDAERCVEIGFSVLPEFQRRGYAGEIVEALVSRAFDRPNVDRVIARTTDANGAAVAVLLRHGFVCVDRASDDIVRFERRKVT